MNAKITLLITVSLLLKIASLNAQSVFGLQELSNEVQKINSSDAGRQSANIEGTPYLNDEFSPGNVILNDSTIYKDIPLRYNAYSDQMEFKHSNGVVLILDKAGSYKEVQIGEKRFVYTTLSCEKNKFTGFFEILVKGKATLFKKYTVNITDPQPAQPFKDPVPAQYQFKPESYYIVMDDKTISVSNEKSLLNDLSDKGGLAAFIKKNKLKTRKQEDLAEIVQYINSIE